MYFFKYTSGNIKTRKKRWENQCDLRAKICHMVATISIIRLCEFAAEFASNLQQIVLRLFYLT